MASFLAQGLKLLRPREGWPAFLLAGVALLCPAAALLTAGDNPAAFGLLVLTVLGIVVGLRLARSNLPARRAALWAGLLGLGLVVLVIGRLLPPFSLVWTDIGYAADWLKDWRQGQLQWPLPFASTAAFTWQQLTTLGLRLWWWGQTVATGGQAQDPFMGLLCGGFLAWAFAVWAMWQIYRRRSALAGLLPSGVSMAVLAFFLGGLALFYLVTYLFCTLWLVAICHLWSSRERWEQSNTDYPGDLGVELVIALAPWLLVILVLAGLFPALYSNPVREAVWRLLDAPWSRVERVAEQLFGPIEGGSGGIAGSPGRPGGELPRAHLLGGRPELGQTIVLYVRTNEPPPPLPGPPEGEGTAPAAPRHYWRSATYDVYTGLGWDNHPVEGSPLSASQPVHPSLAPGSDLLQQVQRVGLQGDSVYAANAPYRLDEPVQAWWRAPDDLAYLTGEADLYTVLSRLPQPTVAELRARSPITMPLPAELAGRYLALPDTVPQRVLDLAQQVAGNLPTYYDRARAIERYLRRLAYSLDLPEPPTDRDLVDYFLFEWQEGYCDYFASAMVVMARAVGVPARLATGYAQGSYDHEAGRWVVTELDGHSWVEVYFTGVGWVEFEPTPAQPVPERPGGEGLPEAALPPLPRQPAHWWQGLPWALGLLGGILILLAAAVAWLWRPHPALSPAEVVRDRQARLLRWGARLGHPVRDGQTALEYSQALGRVLHVRGQGSRWPQARQASDEAPGQVEELASDFVQAQYGPLPVTERVAWQVRALWARLRRQLVWLWLAPGSPKEGRRRE